MANSHVLVWFGLRIGRAFWNHKPVTVVHRLCGLPREELTVVAETPEATVIFLHSHPRWVAAQRRAHERTDAIRRHPSFRARPRAAQGGGIVPMVRDFRVCSSTDTPA
ncbi:hypothetical protein MPRM_12470 [Mycobacterium parmense]|uniref:Uncharacterized protein n=1 Tax=Mycobacterium parmense TaxID=185642 RepID=A0A7I7YQ17_9MYCO|nr:hypothetical protein MPRM_12470 [Mycobacterium parmense]